MRAANDELGLLNSSLSDEVSSLKASKVALETLTETLKKAKDKIEKDLAFYQNQLGKAIQERDRAVFDKEQLTSELSNAATEVKSMEISLETVNAERSSLEQQLASVREEVIQLQDVVEVREREQEEALRRLRHSGEDILGLESALVAQQTRADSMYLELDVARRALQSSQEIEGRLRVQLHDAETAHASLQGRSIGQVEVIERQQDEISSLSAELLTLKAAADRASLDHLDTKKKLLDREEEVKTLQASLKDEIESSQSEARRLEQQIEALQTRAVQQQQQQVAKEQQVTKEAENVAVDSSSGAQGNSSQGSLDDKASRDKAAQLSSTQHSGVDSDERQQLEILTFMVHDLKIKLAQATHEKVEALMMVAAGENASRAAGFKASKASPPVPPPSSSSLIGGGHVAAASSLLTSILNWNPSTSTSTSTSASNSQTPPPQMRPPSPILPQSVSPHSPRDLHGSSSKKEQELQTQMDEIVAVARQFRVQLSQSSSVVWNTASMPNAKWQAIEKLAKIHKDLSRLKASVPSDSSTNIQEVLGLAEVALSSLERSSRQEAMASLGIGNSHPVAFE